MGKEKLPYFSGDRHTEREPEIKKDLTVRLNRAAGQINGLKKMLENDAYCTDLLVQVSAVTAALNGFCKILIGNHLKCCVADDLKAGQTESVDELVTILQKFLY